MRFNKMAVVIDQNHGFKPFKRPQRCRLQSLTNFDVNILDIDQTNLSSLKKAFEVVKFHRSFSSPCFSLATRVEEEIDTTPRIEILGGHGAPRVRALVVEVAIALASGVDPIPVSSGLGGAYILRSRNGNNIALAKPIDEEPLAFNNPKGFGGLMLGQPGMKRSIRVGETGLRELAAYLLDHGGFASVPPTALVRISHVGFHVNGAENISAPPCKIASLQRFVEHEFDAGELGSSGFSVASIHQIAIFDVRVLNLDRHAGNILVKKNDQKEKYAAGAAELVPIDHGLCLPEWLDDPYFEWLHWPQALVPFSESELVYISNLDPFKDAELLRSELSSLRESSIRVLVLCTIFLKQAAAAGLCLAGIGKMMTRESCSGEENVSVLEDLCTKAKEAIVNASDDEEDNIDSREEKDAFELFQFDIETVHTSADVMHLHQLLQSPPEIAKPPKIAKFSPVRSLPRSQDEELSPLFEETGHEVKTRNDGDESNRTFKENGGDSNGDDSKQGGLTRSKSYSVRIFDLGMAEQHAVTFSAGLSCGGLKPFCIIPSTFLQRAYDQVVHDVDRQRIPVRFVITNAGLVGSDGPNMCGAFDITFMSCLPNMIVMAPSDEDELVDMVATAVHTDDHPICFRYPRGAIVGPDHYPRSGIPIEIGKGKILIEGKDVALLGYGEMVQNCLRARALLSKLGIEVTVADARFCKPLDMKLLRQLCENHAFLVTVEEGSIGGFGSHVSQFIALDGQLDGRTKWRPIVLPDKYIEHALPKEQLALAGLTGHHIAATVLRLLGRTREALLLMC